MGDISFRVATHDDLMSIVDLLENDMIGSTRETATSLLSDNYIKAFEEIDADFNAHITVMLDHDQIIGCAQLNYLRNLTYEGGLRAQIEGVRIHTDYRNQGMGRILFAHMMQLSRDKGCHLIQLTTDKSRNEAYQFYKKIGFKNTHEGFKYYLT